MEWLDRFTQVMNVISNAGIDGIGVTNISQNTGLSMGTLHRMLRDMVDHQLLTQNKVTKKYCLGPLSMVWGSNFVLGQDPSGLLADYCDVLAERTNLYTYLCRFEGGQVYCIYTHQPAQERQKYFVHVGQRLPLHCAAAAKTILAFQPYEDVVALISKETVLKKFTEATKTNLTERLTELRTIRTTKIGRCINELEIGVSALSTPVLINDEEAYFCISLVGSSDYIAEHLEALSAELLKIGDKAGKHLRSVQLLASTNRFS